MHSTTLHQGNGQQQYQQQQQQRSKRSPQIEMRGNHTGDLTYIDKRLTENVNFPSFPGWDAFGRSGNNVFSLILNPWGKIYAQV